MANEQNLIPAKKGEIRNPNGRPKGVPNSKTRMLRLLELSEDIENPVTGVVEGFTIMEQIDMRLIKKARDGDLLAIREILDRLEGKAQQTVDANIKGDFFSQERLIIEVVDATNAEIEQETKAQSDVA